MNKIIFNNQYLAILLVLHIKRLKVENNKSIAESNVIPGGLVQLNFMPNFSIAIFLTI